MGIRTKGIVIAIGALALLSLLYLTSRSTCVPPSVKPANWIYIDHSGRARSAKFRGVHSFVDGVAIVVPSGNERFIKPESLLIDRTFKPVVKECFPANGKTQLGITPVYFSRSVRELPGAYVSREGKISKHRFSQCLAFSPIDRLAVAIIGEHYYLVEDNLERLRPLKFEEVGLCVSDGLVPVRIHQKWGYSDSTGDVIIPPQYEEAREFHFGRAIVKGRSGYFVIDSSGKYCSPGFAELQDFEGDTCLALTQEKLWGILNKDGHLASALRSSSIGKLVGGYRWFEKDGLFGFCDANGQVSSKPEYLAAGNFSEGVAFVAIKKDEKIKTQYIDTSFKVVLQGPEMEMQNLPFIREHLGSFEFHEGLAGRPLVENFGAVRWGFINKEGHFTVPAQFSEIMPFGEGFAGVQLSL